MANNVFVKQSAVEGSGVFASKHFDKGDFVLSIDDTHVVVDESLLTPEQHERDLDYLDNKIVLMQSPEKFINHSCDPNVYVMTKAGVRNVYTMREIAIGDEITYDYTVNGDNDGEFPCHCGSKNCRKTYQGNFFKLPTDLQLHYLPYLDTWFIDKHKTEIEALSKQA